MRGSARNIAASRVRPALSRLLGETTALLATVFRRALVRSLSGWRRWALSCLSTTPSKGCLGHPAIPLGSGLDVRILLGQELFQVTANCTYADLMLLLAPLVWRPRRSLAANAAVLSLLVPGVFVFNLARLVLAVELHGRGLSWDQAITCRTRSSTWRSSPAPSSSLCARIVPPDTRKLLQGLTSNRAGERIAPQSR